MSTLATLIRRVDGVVAGGVAAVASFALAIAVASSFWQVLGRFVFNPLQPGLKPKRGSHWCGWCCLVYRLRCERAR